MDIPIAHQSPYGSFSSNYAFVLSIYTSILLMYRYESCERT